VRRGVAFSVALLVIILIGLGAGAALFGVDSGDITGNNSSDVAAPADESGTSSTTTTVSPLSGWRPYKVTDGVNVRSGPGRTFAVLGTIETGFDVLVICAIDGESVTGPLGPTTKWVRIAFNNSKGYITSAYVATGPAINDPKVIGTCPSV
jgi:uncharacterized protein YgiM (DUF1202 family)